jgi:F-type H+-transporting ATPase subunit b
MGEAKAKGFHEKEGLAQAAQDEGKRVMDEINQKAQADLEAARAQIAKEAEDARRGLKAEAKVFSGAIAEKILGRAVS